MVTVYTKPQCVQCDATKRMLDNLKIEYSTVDVSKNAEAIEKLYAMGFSSAPVVITDSDAWSGFQPDKINGLVV